MTDKQQQDTSSFLRERMSEPKRKRKIDRDYPGRAKGAFAAYQEATAATYDEMDTLNLLAQDAHDSGMTRDQFEELLCQAGYDPRRAKVQANSCWELLEMETTNRTRTTTRQNSSH